MTHWIDDVPYPWAHPLARDLHRRLVDTFYEPTEIRDLVKGAGQPNASKIAFSGQGAHQIWVATLDRAASEGGLRTLLTFIVDQGSLPRSLETFIRELLAAQEPPANPSPGSSAGPDIPGPPTQEEALLFGHDLSESVGEIPGLVEAIGRVMQWRSAVCRLTVTATNGKIYVGTGTLLTGNRVLTNHHVLFPEGQAASAVAVEFHLEEDAHSQAVASKIVRGDAGTLKADPADDWAVVTIPEPPSDVSPLDLGAQVGVAKVPERAFILQHPQGRPKRLAFVRNRISSVEARRVYYLTDTEGGSSGSPVFNAQGQIVALHRAGGTPQKFAGLQPVKKNEGVRMDVIAPAILKAVTS